MEFAPTLTKEFESKVETKALKMYLDDKDINFIVLAVDNPNFGTKVKSYEVEICGKKCVDWVINACNKLPTIKRVDVKHDMMKEIKPLLNDSEWTVVLYSDTPLIKNSTITEAFKCAEEKWLNVCKLTRGYILKTDYAKRADEIFGVETYYFDEEDFIICSNLKQLSIISDIMKNRIIEFLMKKGVRVVDANSTYIESDVVIGKGSVVEPLSVVKGHVEIGEDCVIGYGSKIQNSKIGNNCKTENCQIIESVLLNNVNVCDFSVVKKCLVQDNTKIQNAFVSGANIYREVMIETGAKIESNTGRIKILSGAKIGKNVVIEKPVTIGENAKINALKNIIENIDANAEI